MSVVVFPFKEEDHDVVIRNVTMAAGHPRVTNVVCMGLDEASTHEAIRLAVPEVENSTGTPVTLLLQDRIGTLRHGKGDAMNTSLRYFLEHSTDERLHFYDADITSFDQLHILSLLSVNAKNSPNPLLFAAGCIQNSSAWLQLP